MKEGIGATIKTYSFITISLDTYYGIIKKNVASTEFEM